MRKKNLETLGFVLANPIRRIIIQQLTNPKVNPKSYSKIKNGVSEEIGKPISDGSLSWYLKDLLAHDLIEKNNDKHYTVTQEGENISLIIQNLY